MPEYPTSCRMTRCSCSLLTAAKSVTVRSGSWIQMASRNGGSLGPTRIASLKVFNGRPMASGWRTSGSTKHQRNGKSFLKAGTCAADRQRQYFPPGHGGKRVDSGVLRGCREGESSTFLAMMASMGTPATIGKYLLTNTLENLVASQDN